MPEAARWAVRRLDRGCGVSHCRAGARDAGQQLKNKDVDSGGLYPPRSRQSAFTSPRQRLHHAPHRVAAPVFAVVDSCSTDFLPLCRQRPSLRLRSTCIAACKCRATPQAHRTATIDSTPILTAREDSDILGDNLTAYCTSSSRVQCTRQPHITSVWVMYWSTRASSRGRLIKGACQCAASRYLIGTQPLPKYRMSSQVLFSMVPDDCHEACLWTTRLDNCK